MLAWLEFVSCTIGGTLVLTDAEIRGLNLRGTQVSKIEAERLHSEGIVALNKTTRVNGIINLKGARIDGDLNCFGCNINGGGGLAFNAFGAEIKGNVFLNNKFKAKGQVDLSGTNIAGHIICDDGCFECHSVKTDGKETREWALILDQATIGGSVMLRFTDNIDNNEEKTYFYAIGGVRMHTGRIGGNLECGGGRFRGSRQSEAISLAGTEIKGNVFFTSNEKEQFLATGTVQLVNAKISGSTYCGG